MRIGCDIFIQSHLLRSNVSTRPIMYCTGGKDHHCSGSVSYNSMHPASGSNCIFRVTGSNTNILQQQDSVCEGRILKELGTSRTHSAVIRCLTICQHIPVVRKNHKNQLTQQFNIICCLARGLALCIESKQIMSLLSCESATLKRGPQLCGQRCGPYLRH